MNSTSKTFEDFLATESVQLAPLEFVANMLLAAALAWLLGVLYTRYGHALSNRRQFGQNFMLLSLATMVVITIVKSSLALSLGLVGALSIVRFRAAIKEPEELTYLFIAIAIGLGFGADQRLITLLAFAILAGIIVLRARFSKHEAWSNLHLTVESKAPSKLELDAVMVALREHCTSVDLRRFDESEDALEASFVVEFADDDALNAGRQALNALGQSVRLTFLDYKALS